MQTDWWKSRLYTYSQKSIEKSVGNQRKNQKSGVAMRALLFCSVYNYNTSPQTGAGPAAAQASRDIRPAGRLAATTTGVRAVLSLDREGAWAMRTL